MALICCPVGVVPDMNPAPPVSRMTLGVYAVNCSPSTLECKALSNTLFSVPGLPLASVFVDDLLCMTADEYSEGGKECNGETTGVVETNECKGDEVVRGVEEAVWMGRSMLCV